MCHGHENMILIEKNYNITKKNIKKTFLNVHSYSDYKTIPKFKYSNKRLTGTEKEILDSYIKING